MFIRKSPSHTSLTNTGSIGIVGAGLVGSLSALTLAKDEQQKIRLFKRPEKHTRLLGELLHPLGSDIIKQLGFGNVIEKHTLSKLSGFSISDPQINRTTIIRYPDNRQSRIIDHHTFITELQQDCIASDNIEIINIQQLESVSRGKLEVLNTSKQLEVHTDFTLLVGADGRESKFRALLNDTPPKHEKVSIMIGITLTSHEFDDKNVAHLFLGGPGVILLYRIGSGQYRCMIDVPYKFKGYARDTQWLIDQYTPILPTSLAASFTTAINDTSSKAQYAGAHRLSHQHLNAPFAILAGDATGYSHPITATGMTCGMLDVQGLQRIIHSRYRQSKTYSPKQYARDRIFSRVATDSFNAIIYDVFTHHNDANISIRRSLHDVLSTSAKQSDNAISIMGAEDQSTNSLIVFLAIVLRHAVDAKFKEGGIKGLLKIRKDFTAYADYLKQPSYNLWRASYSYALNH